MTTALKCPNSSCPYAFDPATLPTGVVLACPRCGMRFTLGAPTQADPNASPAPNPGMSANDPGTGYPAPPGALAPALAQPNPARGTMSRQTARADGEDEPRPPNKTSRLQMYLLAGATAVALAAGGVAIYVKLTHGEGDYSGDSSDQFKDLNVGYEPPPSPWVRDDSTPNDVLGAPFILAYRRENPEAYMAFGARDYKTRQPRDSELNAALMTALGKLIDVSSLKQETPLDHTWMGQEVKGFRFHAQLKSGATVDGEAYRIHAKGIGYWFLSWTGENNVFEEMQPAFAEWRKHCKLLDIRNDWKEKQSSIVPFKGDHVGYTLLDAEGVWDEDRDEANLKYEGADKILFIKRGKNKDLIEDGHLLVYIRPGGGDPMTEARALVEQKRRDEIKKAGDYPIEFKEITAPPDGDAIQNPLDNPLPVLRLQSIVKGAGSQNQFHVISAAHIDDKIVIVHAFCSLENRAKLDTLLMQIASSLHGGS